MTSSQIEERRKNSPHYKLAARIAQHLFTNGSGERAHRLEIKLLDAHQRERSGGGWCESAVIDRIAEHLEASTAPVVKDRALG